MRTLLEQSEKVIGSYDMMIAAIAQAHELTLVTRNVKALIAELLSNRKKV